MRTDQLLEQVNIATRLLSEFGDQAAMFDRTRPLPEQELAARAGNQQFYTVLLADHSGETAGIDDLTPRLRSLRQSADDVRIEYLVVTSVEDAITAVALNGDIQAAIIRHDLPLRSTDRLPLMTRLLGVERHPVATDRLYESTECGQWIRELRPHIDLYLLTDESIAAGLDTEPDVYDRTFYRLNDVTDLHSTVIAGIRRRYATPFFDALRAYAASPVGQFHALPVARGASIFNSTSLQDMGEFYGRNIFMAETSSTSGGLDSLLDPHGTIRQAMDKAATTWNADQTYFVTNGTSTANKIVVQALTQPGDIVLIDRNCHKSHHYGLVLAGANPLYLDAYPLADYAMYGGVPLTAIKQALLDLEAVGRLDRVRMVLLTNCTFDGIVYNPLQVMQEILAIKPDICFLWDEAWYAFATAVPWARQRTAMVAADTLDPEARLTGIRPAVRRLARGDGRRGQGRLGRAPAAARSRARPGPRLRHPLHAQVAVRAAASVDDPHPRPGLRPAHPRAVRRGVPDPHLDLPEPAAVGLPGPGPPAGRHRGLPDGPLRLHHGVGLPEEGQHRPG